ncbi:MAG: hypothetical protein M1839_001833 [Geoglossum umbratile]|nr:MAG: hypothetical protein M1839_001833 [Geoglossum umbratile]
MGGSGFGFSMNYSQARAAACSTCFVKQDMSNYWVPSLYFRAANGSFISVQQSGGGTIYYEQRKNGTEELTAFPPGFRMLAGSPNLRHFGGDTASQAISYACLDFTHGGGPETHGFPDKNCPNGLRAQVFFPSCWDGVNLDSPDHKSHMSYPSTYNGGYCPDTHPKRFISLFYEVIWNTNVFKDMWTGSKQPFTFSHGDDSGYGYHGDFVNGWDTAVLQQAIDTCTSDSGNLEDCPVLDRYPNDILQDCRISPSIGEKVFGVLDALPGCNPVQSGPGDAVPHSGCGAATIIGQPQVFYTDLTASRGWKYIGCGHDSNDQGGRTLKGASNRDPGMTVENCVDFCISKGFSIAGLEYSNECYCDNALPQDRAPIPGVMGNCNKPCAGDTTETCGGGSRLSLYQACPHSGPCENLAPVVVGNTTATTPGAASQAPTSISSQPTRTTTSLTGTTQQGSSASTTKQTSRASIGTAASTASPGSSVTLPGGWKSLGCYVDPINPRALDNWAHYDDSVTSSGCVSECDDRGYKFAGTENSGQCFCGNSLQGATAADSADCNMPCDGDANQICGGSARLSVFTNGQSAARMAHRHRHQAYRI